MNSCCSNEIANLCTECGTATVVGASFSLPVLIAGLVVTAVAVIAARQIVRRAVGGHRAVATA